MEEDTSFYLLICPQNVVGSTIMDHLRSMVRPPLTSFLASVARSAL